VAVRARCIGIVVIGRRRCRCRCINADTASLDFPCTRGTFEMIRNTILHLPSGSQVAIRDVAETHRTIPIKQAQWPGTAVCISQSESAIDKCQAFGYSLSVGVYSNLADASANIFRAERIGPISKWADDFVFFHIPPAQIAYYNQLRKAQQNNFPQWRHAKDGGHLWFKGAKRPDRSVEEFDDSHQHPSKRSRSTPIYPTHYIITYSLDHANAISEKLGMRAAQKPALRALPHLPRLSLGR
jgi:hypothetical protein